MPSLELIEYDVRRVQEMLERIDREAWDTEKSFRNYRKEMGFLINEIWSEIWSLRERIEELERTSRDLSDKVEILLDRLEAKDVIDRGDV